MEAALSDNRIAVAGATGRIGTALIAQLVEAPVEVVALTRDVNTDRLPADLRRRAVDFADQATLEGAMQGASRLFLAHGTSPQQTENEIALIDAAVRAGVSHIVKVSAMGPASKLHPFDWHMKIEAHLATYDIGYTVLRASTFVDILTRDAISVASGTWGGSSKEGRVNLVDTRDVADVAFKALLDNHHVDAQRAFHLTGPAAVTMTEIAEELTRLLDRKVTYEHRTPEAQREYLIQIGWTEMTANMRLGLERIFRESVLSETTDTYKMFTGQEPRSVANWLADNIDAFQRGRYALDARGRA